MSPETLPSPEDVPGPSRVVSPSIARLTSLDGRTVGELSAAWNELRRILSAQVAACASLSPERSGVTELAEFRSLRAASGERGLTEPCAHLDRYAPVRRALVAADLHESALEAWLRSQPEIVPLEGRAAVEMAGALGSRSWWRWPAGRRRRELGVPFRRILAEQARRLKPRLERLDGECFAALADALLQVRRQWEAHRLAMDALVDRGIDAGDLRRAREVAEAEARRTAERVERALAKRRVWLEGALLPAVGSGVLRYVAVRRIPRDLPPARRSAWIGRWRRLLEAVRRELALEEALEARTLGLLESLERGLSAAAAEDTALFAELDRLVRSLAEERGREGELELEIVWTPAAARLARLDRTARDEAARLPSSARVGVRPRARPGRPADGRSITPADAFLATYRRAIRPSCAGLFEVIEAHQREIADDLQRAGDVVAFAAGAAETGEAGAEIVDEAVDNATALLEFRRDVPARRQTDGMRAAAAICRACRDLRIALHGRVASRVAHRVRREMEQGVPAILSAGLSASGGGVRALVRLVRTGVRAFLTHIGWLAEAPSGARRLAVRPVLPKEFASRTALHDVPPLYGHLFKPDPVDDPRFLVGREAELEAIADARERWEAGHAAAVVVTGERGSGKTSLINCALLGPLDGLEVVRGEFHERVLSVEDLYRTVGRVVGAEPDELEAHLASAPRVIVMEEFERTFLRHIGHYEAARALGRLINATCGSAFWILGVNQIAYRFLDAATGLGQRFSHRINAGTATVEQVRQAVLVRHNLSGLRLHFERAPGGRRFRVPPPFGTAREDPETVFFRTLARRSGGVYRTTFNLWLAHIEAVEDGLLTVRAPPTDDLGAVVEDLTLPDIFSLVALLQHGSLTPQEHAIVFQEPVESSRARIDELVSRELVGADPGRPGVRVRPEAMSVVQAALFRRNLL